MAIQRSVIAPRIVPRDRIGNSLGVVRSTDPRRTCRRTITLDGRLYRCGRVTYGLDADRGLGTHDGIHDAFAEHGDGGSVRW